MSFRYNHELDGCEDEADDSDEQSIFSSFSCCSPRYSQVYSSSDKDLEELRRSYKTRMNSNSSVTSAISDDNSVTSNSTTRSDGNDSSTVKNSGDEETVGEVMNRYVGIWSLTFIPQRLQSVVREGESWESLFFV